jgi:hypothetical protein
MGTMLDQLNKALQSYRSQWQALVEQRKDRAFFDALIPTSVGWKVKETADFDALVRGLRDLCDHVMLVRMNGRWVAKLVLRDTRLEWGIRIIKILQLRPGSKDTVGMDHVDFYSNLSEKQIEEALAREDIKWSHEENRPGYIWASVWFDGTEAKIKNYTILDIHTQDLSDISTNIKGGK